MKTVDIRDARTHLTDLVEKASDGEAFVIAKAGRPLVKVVPIEDFGGTREPRIGFLAGRFAIPDDFDRMGEAEIAEMFGLSE